MNKVFLIGRLTRNPEVKYAGKDNNMAVARYTLAVNRRYKKDGEQEADFISCVVFSKGAEFAQKYLRKGMKIAVSGRISTGNYKDKEGRTIYTTDVIVEEHEFAESAREKETPEKEDNAQDEGFMDVPADEELPFE